VRRVTVDPRLAEWRKRLEERSREAAAMVGRIPGVVGVILGGSVGGGEPWPLSDIDLIVVCNDRNPEHVGAVVSDHAYRLSEMWGTGGIYTAVDAGRLTLTSDEVGNATSGGVPGAVEGMTDPRLFHLIDKSFGGATMEDPTGIAGDLLEWVNRMRFNADVVSARIDRWFDWAKEARLSSMSALGAGDTTGAWIALRKAAAALSEVATERWGERSSSLGRYWTRFEARAGSHGASGLARDIFAVAHAHPESIQPMLAYAPAWLHDRINLSYVARRMVEEDVSPNQNARDNVLAYALLYRSRFPTADQEWLRAGRETDITASLTAIGKLINDLRVSDASTS
jgi:predicted nucleotidyltransferase